MGRSSAFLAAAVGALLVGASAPSAAAQLASRDAAVAVWQQISADLDVPPGWTGSVAGCVPGAQSDASAAATLRTINTLRQIAGLGPVGVDAAQSAQAQDAALMMRAQGQLSHSPDPSWACYTASGAQGASTSNLALGYPSGPQTVLGYMADSGTPSLGHRRWLLHPTMQTIGLGQTDGSNAMRVLGPHPAVDAGRQIAWPSPGFVPAGLITKYWSLSATGIVDFSGANVSVTAAGQPLVVSDVADAGFGYGGAAALRWQVALGDLLAGDVDLRVQVTGIVADGQPLSADYTVRSVSAATPTPPPDSTTHGDTTPGASTPVTTMPGATTPGGHGIDIPGMATGDVPAGATTPGTGPKAPTATLTRPKLVRPKAIRRGSRLRARMALPAGARVTAVRWRRNGTTVRTTKTLGTYTVARRDRARTITVRVSVRLADGRIRAVTSAGVKVPRRLR